MCHNYERKVLVTIAFKGVQFSVDATVIIALLTFAGGGLAEVGRWRHVVRRRPKQSKEL
jgi:hypothetical protein